ncbi:hypothetical protein U1Q18_020293 [Sarracenia purpurea var. burkii]
MCMHLAFLHWYELTRTSMTFVGTVQTSITIVLQVQVHLAAAFVASPMVLVIALVLMAFALYVLLWLRFCHMLLILCSVTPVRPILYGFGMLPRWFCIWVELFPLLCCFMVKLSLVSAAMGHRSCPCFSDALSSILLWLGRCSVCVLCLFISSCIA